MTAKKSARKKKEPLSDRARHARFVKVAKEVGVDERPEAFDKAFKRVVRKQVT